MNTTISSCNEVIIYFNLYAVSNKVEIAGTGYLWNAFFAIMKFQVN